MGDQHSSKHFWIYASISSPPSERAKIRRQVIKTIALRRKQEPKRPHPNVRQYPVFIPSDHLGGVIPSPEELRNRDIACTLDENVRQERGDSDPAFVECGDFHGGIGMPISRALQIHCPEILAQCKLDFLDLSLLTSHQVGRFTGPKLLEHPRRISHFLGRKARSYCQYVPGHYGPSAL